jgi:transcriptional regulator with XRE-family HTH domain
MARIVSVSGTGLLAEIRACLGVSLADMGRLLGLAASYVGLVETGHRPLPPAGWTRLRALEAALRASPTALPVPDLQPLWRRHAQCQAQALQLGLQLNYYLPAQAAVARTRLQAAGALPAALTAADAEEALSPSRREDQQGQLTMLINAAHNAWEDSCGPVPVALLRARLAGLQAEAAALAQALADEAAGTRPGH